MDTFIQCLYVIGLFLALWNGMDGIEEGNYGKILGSLFVGTLLAANVGGLLI